MHRRSIRWQPSHIALVMAMVVSLAVAQTTAPPAKPPPTAGTAPPSAAPAGAPASKEQLEQLLAPIALYPDSLLSQVLMAATYPADVAEAAKWVKAHPDNKGDAGVKAVQDQPWDPSVQSLAAFPQILDMMGAQPDWSAEARRRLPRIIERRARRGAAPAAEGAAGWQPEVDRAAKGDRRAGADDAADDHQGRAGTARDHLRAGVQPDGGVRRLAVPVVSAVLLPAAAVLLPRWGARLGNRIRPRRGGCRCDLGWLQLGPR